MLSGVLASATGDLSAAPHVAHATTDGSHHGSHHFHSEKPSHSLETDNEVPGDPHKLACDAELCCPAIQSLEAKCDGGRRVAKAYFDIDAGLLERLAVESPFQPPR